MDAPSILAVDPLATWPETLHELLIRHELAQLRLVDLEVGVPSGR